MVDFCLKNNVEIRENEPLSKHSSFRIGGPVKYAIFPYSITQLISVISELKNKNLRYKVIGNASNILFDDKGYDGALIFTKNMCQTEYIHRDGYTLVRSECGKSLTELASEVGKKHSLSGLEFAYGIPGSLGGAVYMNAGAYGGEIADIVVESECLDTKNGNIIKLSAEEHKFSYRHSFFLDDPSLLILSTTLRLKIGNIEDIFNTMHKNMSSRKEKQPLEYPNAGSTFKRPTGHFAGKLIEDAGLKGFWVGGAQVSEKHAGFVINRNDATSADILKLIEHIKNTVFKSFGVDLECEIIYIPYK